VNIIKNFFFFFTTLWLLVLIGIYLLTEESQAYLLLWYSFGIGIAIYLLGSLIILVLSIIKKFKQTGKLFSWQLVLVILILIVPIYVLWYATTH
jgi:hypothetical protein